MSLCLLFLCGWRPRSRCGSVVTTRYMCSEMKPKLAGKFPSYKQTRCQAFDGNLECGDYSMTMSWWTILHAGENLLGSTRDYLK